MPRRPPPPDPLDQALKHLALARAAGSPDQRRAHIASATWALEDARVRLAEREDVVKWCEERFASAAAIIRVTVEHHRRQIEAAAVELVALELVAFAGNGGFSG